MRRAASSAYYALFHGLCRLCANELIGANQGKTEEWARVYRALDHGRGKKVLTEQEAGKIDPAVKRVGLAFKELQERRHGADYDPAFFPFFLDATAALIEQAESALALLDALSPDKRRALAVLLLFPLRKS